MILPSYGHLAILGDIFGCHKGGDWESSLVGRGQWNQGPYNAQVGQTPYLNKELNYLAQNVNCATEKHWSKLIIFWHINIYNLM